MTTFSIHSWLIPFISNLFERRHSYIIPTAQSMRMHVHFVSVSDVERSSEHHVLQ